MKCEELRETIYLLLYDEVSAEERQTLESHLADCANCGAELEKVRSLRSLLGSDSPAEPSAALLAECRQLFEEALDREELGWHGLVREWWGMRAQALAFRAVTAVTLLILGFGLGWNLRLRSPVAPESGRPGAGSPPQFSSADLSNLRISGISQVAPDPETGAVRITMNAERRVALEGSLDDPRIQEVLLYAIKNYDNPGIRRDTLEALRRRGDDPGIRQAMLYALQHDENVGVRLEALKAVSSRAHEPEVRQALLEVLQRDTNPGVRVAAVNALVDYRDDEVQSVLERLAAGDPNTYVRLKSARATHRLGDDEESAR